MLPLDFELFRAHSEGLHPRGPKQNHYIPRLGAPVLYMLPLLPLVGQALRFRLRKPISLIANIADMYIPSQIICDSDPNILDAFDIFEDRSIQSMDLFDPFPCYLHHIVFDRLKSHTQFPCPASQLIYIFLKF